MLGVLAVHLVEEQPCGSQRRLDLVYPELGVLGAVVALHPELVALMRCLFCNRARHVECDFPFQERGLADELIEVARLVERFQRLFDALPEPCAPSVFQGKRQEQNCYEREVDEENRIGGRAEYDEQGGDEGDGDKRERQGERLVAHEADWREPGCVLILHRGTHAAIT